MGGEVPVKCLLTSGAAQPDADRAPFDQPTEEHAAPAEDPMAFVTPARAAVQSQLEGRWMV